jgi:hypothetical protein
MRILFLPLALGLLAPGAGCLTGPRPTGRSADGPAKKLPNGDEKKAREKEEEARNKLIAEVIRRGGSICMELDKPDKPIVVLDLHRFHDAVAILAALGPLPHLKELNLYATEFTDADLERGRGLDELHTLNLSATRITDAGLAALAHFPNLHTLYLNETKVSDAGLRTLRSLANLRNLSLFETRITDDGLAEVAAMKKLEKLTLGGRAISDRGVEQLRGMPKLFSLELFHTRVSAAEADDLRAAMPHLRVLH